MVPPCVDSWLVFSFDDQFQSWRLCEDDGCGTCGPPGWSIDVAGPPSAPAPTSCIEINVKQGLEQGECVQHSFVWYDAEPEFTPIAFAHDDTLIPNIVNNSQTVSVELVEKGSCSDCGEACCGGEMVQADLSLETFDPPGTLDVAEGTTGSHLQFDGGLWNVRVVQARYFPDCGDELWLTWGALRVNSP